MNNTIPDFVAHISEDGLRYESVLQHMNEVAELAATFASSFGAWEWAYDAGILHDIGKYSEKFQQRILYDGPRVDHSTAGAFEAARHCSLLVAYCIAGHHGGLPDGGSIVDDGGTLMGRLARAQKGKLPDYAAFAREVEIPGALGNPPFAAGSKQDLMFSATFFTRMVFSCLVDADFLCTERFMRGNARVRPTDMSLNDMRQALEQKLSSFYPPTNRLNTIRCRVLDDCAKAAALEPGVFSLTVPTGGGKTYALIRFALTHATHAGRTFGRVIVAEPYTSIIEQNAEVYRQVFGEDAVLEHHSNYDFGDSFEEGEGYDNPLRLASENWDAPLVVTTNVQLFESLFASKTSRCRKLHNIAQSVIVLDEAQMIPLPFLKPCIKALCELVKHYGCSVVLCSATQPALNEFFEKEGLGVTEIASRPRELVDELRRVTYRSLGTVEDEELAQRLLDCDQTLCIVNSRKQARVLYDLVHNLAQDSYKDEGGCVFHLTTLMYPSHRSRTIEEIRQRVKAGKRCLVVATSLVEAGVDLDFGTVFRASTGIDSLVQAAGRCNREMTRKANESTVYVFEPAKDYAIPGELRQRAQMAWSIDENLREIGAQPEVDSLDTIERYFANLYQIKGNGLDEKGIVEQLSQDNLKTIPFATVAEEFRLVDDVSMTVIVPTEDNARDIEMLVGGFATRATMRRLGRFGVGIYRADCEALLRAGAIERVGNENVFLLVDQGRYREDVGLDLQVTMGEAVFL